jgi:hypothetical protein
MSFLDKHQRTVRRVIPMTEALCRPAKWCEMQHKCVRYQQSPLPGQPLRDRSGGRYKDCTGAQRCTFFVAQGLDKADTPAQGPRTFKHWSDQ